MNFTKKDILIYSSIGLNIIIIFIFLVPKIGGWLFISVLYGVIMTIVALFFLIKSVNISNDFQDILESHLDDQNVFLEKLEPFIAPGSQLEYSDEVKSLISGVLAFKNRLVSRLNAYYEDDKELEPEPIENLLPKNKQKLSPINTNSPVYNLPRKNVPLIDNIKSTQSRIQSEEIPMSR